MHSCRRPESEDDTVEGGPSSLHLKVIYHFASNICIPVFSLQHRPVCMLNISPEELTGGKSGQLPQGPRPPGAPKSSGLLCVSENHSENSNDTGLKVVLTTLLCKQNTTS